MEQFLKSREEFFDDDIGEGVVRYIFNSEGPVFGPNGEYELDPDNEECLAYIAKVGEVENIQVPIGLPVFGTCKNNCRGGKLLIHNT